MPSFKLPILLRVDLSKGQFVQPLFMRSYSALYLLWDLKPYGNMWPESFGGFTFDLGPLL